MSSDGGVRPMEGSTLASDGGAEPRNLPGGNGPTEPDGASEVEASTSPALPGAFGRFGLPALWVLAVIFIAAGAAGMLAGIDHPPGTAAREELTWVGDRQLAPALASASADLLALSREVDELGVEGRRILAAVAARDTPTIGDGVSAGSAFEAGITRDAAALRSRLESLLGSDPNPRLRFSQVQLSRHELALQAVDTTRGISDAWARLISGAGAASRIAELLTDHDTQMARAAEQGRAQAYADAVGTITGAIAILDQANALRNDLAATTSVDTLDVWLQRNRTFDDALEALYAAFRDSYGKVTQEVSRAFTAEEDARAQLPPDSRGLVLIMAEISQGGLNQAVIAIEGASQALANSLEALPESGGTGPAGTGPAGSNLGG